MKNFTKVLWEYKYNFLWIWFLTILISSSINDFEFSIRMVLLCGLITLGLISLKVISINSKNKNEKL